MIIKVPVYLELDEKLTPDQVSDLSDAVQGLLTKDIQDISSGKLKWNIFGRRYNFKLLTRGQVQSRITGPSQATKKSA